MRFCTRVTFDSEGKLDKIIDISLVDDNHEATCDTEGVHILGEVAKKVAKRVTKSQAQPPSPSIPPAS